VLVGRVGDVGRRVRGRRSRKHHETRLLRRCVKHGAIVGHGHLLDLEPKVVDGAFELGTPRVHVSSNRLQGGDAGVTFVSGGGDIQANRARRKRIG